MSNTQERFTLKQVADSIKKTIETRYNRTYWVTAEMHKLNQTKKGHCYPELVQKENDSIVVEMRATIWKNSFESIQRKFIEVVKEPLSDGLELLFLVRVVYHPIYNLGLEIIDIDPTFALGALQRERQETIEKLHKEGVLNANQQLDLPLLPKRLAVISQSNSKGYSDFQQLLNGHPKRYHFHTLLFEATLQGDAAVQSISSQLKRIKSIKHHFDAVVIIRGGGGEVGMHCYNNYQLSKAIATFPLPIFTGIGHSTNMTVCEMVAFNNGITPSDLAYFLLRIFEELDEPLDEFKSTLPLTVQRLMLRFKQQFEQSIADFQTETKQAFRYHYLQQQQLIKAFEYGSNLLIQHQKSALNNSKTMVGIHSANQLEKNRQSILQLGVKFQSLPVKMVEQHRQKIDTISKHLSLVDPQEVLKRGYAIVTNEKGIVGIDNCPAEGEKIHINLAEVNVDARIEKIINK